jgi:nitrite reductase (NO-forming)
MMMRISKYIVLVLFVGVAATACQGTSTSSTPNTMDHGAMAQQVAQDAPDAPLAQVKHELYDASTQPVSEDKIKQINLDLEDKNIEIAPGVPYQAWSFNGSVPGPLLRVRQGDEVHVTLTNKTQMEHSLDFHAAQTPWNVNYKNLKPGETYTYTWTADYPGIFMYHCGTAPALAHIANGMYGAIIVEPAEGLPPAKEYVLIQSEFYAKKGTDGFFHYDGTKAIEKQPDYVVFNGYANQYQESPLTADPGERIRLWVLNAGPSEFSAFHIVGAIFDKAYADGDPKNAETGRQTVTVPPGGGYMVELTVPAAGLYPFVTHSFADPGKGALGFLDIGDVKMEAGMSH